MRSTLANALQIFMASALFAGYACKSDGALTQPGSDDASPAATGGSAAGGTMASGGSGSGGYDRGGTSGGTTASTSIPVGSGGATDSCSMGYPGNPFCGGTTGSAGATGSAGTVGSAGATGSGGMAGASGTGIPSDAAPAGTGCSCAAGTTSWGCYCQVFDCGKTISAYTTDGGAAYDVMMEYANCNLVEYWTISSVAELIDVFDLTTGQLVGQIRSNGALKDNACPFGGTDGPLYNLTAGRLPESTCVRSKCVTTSPISDMCVSPPRRRATQRRVIPTPGSQIRKPLLFRPLC